MGSVVDIQVDVSGFNEALREYEQASRKDRNEIVNKVGKDLCLLMAQRIQKGVKEIIRQQTEGQPWWPKFISKLLHNRQGTFTRAQARGLSNRIIGRRIKAIGFLRIAWIKAAIGFGASGTGAKWNLTQAQGKGTPATLGFDTAYIAVSYAPKKELSVARSKRIVEPTWQEVIDYKTRDMRDYIERKLVQRATEYSAK